MSPGFLVGRRRGWGQANPSPPRKVREEETRFLHGSWRGRSGAAAPDHETGSTCPVLANIRRRGYFANTNIRKGIPGSKKKFPRMDRGGVRS